MPWNIMGINQYRVCTENNMYIIYIHTSQIHTTSIISQHPNQLSFPYPFRINRPRFQALLLGSVFFPNGCYVTLVWEGWRGDILEFNYQRFIIPLDSSQKSEGVFVEGFGQVSAKKLVYWLYVDMYIYNYISNQVKLAEKTVPFFS